MTTTATETVTARATAYAPAPGRSRWLLATRCPWCGFTHHHTERRWIGEPVLKNPQCAPWRVYRVRVERVDLTGSTREGGQK